MKIDQNENIKKVVMFDSWTKGSIHIFRLLEKLKENSIDITLVHAGSWGDEVGRPMSEVINGLKVHDISKYGNLENVLNVEQPNTVLFLSLDPLLHRAFNRYCIKYKIPTVHLYHGVHSVFTSLSTDSKKIVGYWGRLVKNIINRLWRVFFVYSVSLLKTKASFEDCKKLFYVDIYRKIFGIAVDVASDDAKTDHICVFNIFDKQQSLEKFSIPENNIHVVGYPDILKFPGLENLICKFVVEHSHDNENILYIGTGIRGTRMRLADDELYFKFLLNTYNELIKYNKNIIFKLHYSRLESVKTKFHNINVYPIFCDDNEFIEYLSSSCGAIVEPSTAALVPVLLGKPIFLTQYNTLHGLEFGDIISSYPKAISLTNIGDFIKTSLPFAFDDKKTISWIKAVSGPLPASLMPTRVVDTIILAINKSSKSGISA